MVLQRLLMLCVCLAWSSVATSQTSTLWGTSGDAYVIGGRLLDYSYAGYAAGEASIPTLDPTVNVMDYGATGDGITDDTDAVMKVLQSMKGGVLYFPAGRYVLTQRLDIRTRISLKGDGSNVTVLVFPKSLMDIYGDPYVNSNFSNYRRTVGSAAQEAPGLIEYNGINPHQSSSTTVHPIPVIQQAFRGTNVIQVYDTSALVPGQWVSITMASPQPPDLFLDMNMDVDSGCDESLCQEPTVAYSFQSRIAQVVDNTTLILERPLPYNLTNGYQPILLWQLQASLANIGIEGLAFEFKSERYLGHFKEMGWNGLQLRDVVNAWITDVLFMNVDIGISVFYSNFVTVQNVMITATAGRADSLGYTGHHGINVKGSVDCLVQDFTIETRMVHDLTVDKFACGNVFSQGRGWDLNMDHHKAQNYANLWTELDAGVGSRAFESGGAAMRGPSAGALTTFWNILGRAPRTHGLMSNFGPYLNFIGVPNGTMYPRPSKWTTGWFIENISSASLHPPNIYVAQRHLRLTSPHNVSLVLGGQGYGGQSLVVALDDTGSIDAWAEYRLERDGLF